MSETTSTGGIDKILTTYFQAQVPTPWPEWHEPAPRLMPMARRPVWLTYSRLAVAASVGVILVTYLALAGFFPRETGSRLNSDPMRNIGQKASIPSVQPNR